MLDPQKLLALAAAYDQGRAQLEAQARLALLTGDGAVFIERCEQAKRTRKQAEIFRERAQAA